MVLVRLHAFIIPSAPLASKQEQLVISIDRDKHVDINDLQVGADFLKEKLEKILETRKSREVYLKADKDVPYGVVVRIMSEIKGAGVEKLGMLTKPVENNKSS